MTPDLATPAGVTHVSRSPIGGPEDAEDARNRVLRRSDWRFLLASPNPALSMVCGEGKLAEAVRAVSQRVVNAGREQRPDAICDLAVCQEPSEAMLRSLWSALRPGGSCYTEWTSRMGPGPPLIRSRLAAAGFTDVICYSPRPWPARHSSQVWLPLGVSSARRWHVSQPGDGPLQYRIARTARRIGWMAGNWLPLTGPICAVARKPARSGDPSAHPLPPTADFQGELRRAIREHGPGGVVAPWVLLTPGAHVLNKLVLLAIGSDGRVEFVVKAPRTAASDRAVEREAAVLDAIHKILGDVSGIPRVLFADSCAGVPVVGETALHGTPVSQLARRCDYRALGMQTARWQAKLVHVRASSSDESWWRRLIEPILIFLDGPLAAIVDAESIRVTKRAVAGLRPLPMACEQRDFSPWNVLFTPAGELAVLDWESGEPCGLPALDLIYFLTYLAACRGGALTNTNVQQAHRSTLDPATTTGTIATACLRRYVELVGMDPSQLPHLRLVCWLVHARSEYGRMEDALGRPPDPSALRDSLFVSLWKQELSMASGAPV